MPSTNHENVKNYLSRVEKHFGCVVISGRRGRSARKRRNRCGVGMNGREKRLREREKHEERTQCVLGCD